MFILIKYPTHPKVLARSSDNVLTVVNPTMAGAALMRNLIAESEELNDHYFSVMHSPHLSTFVIIKYHTACICTCMCFKLKNLSIFKTSLKQSQAFLAFCTFWIILKKSLQENYKSTHSEFYRSDSS